MIAEATFVEMGNDYIDMVRAGVGTEEDAGMNYRQLLRKAERDGRMMDFGPINAAIKARWGADGLRRVKEMAWDSPRETELEAAKKLLHDVRWELDRLSEFDTAEMQSRVERFLGMT